MRTKLKQLNSVLALVLDEEVIREWGVKPYMDLKIDVDGDTLLVTPIRNAQRRKVFEAANIRINEQYFELLQKLAE